MCVAQYIGHYPCGKLCIQTCTCIQTRVAVLYSLLTLVGWYMWVHSLLTNVLMMDSLNLAQNQGRLNSRQHSHTACFGADRQ